MKTLADYIDALVPNDLCARCDEKEPVYFELFGVKIGGDNITEKVLKLGFCGQECCAAFVRGIEASRTLPIL